MTAIKSEVEGAMLHCFFVHVVFNKFHCSQLTWSNTESLLWPSDAISPAGYNWHGYNYPLFIMSFTSHVIPMPWREELLSLQVRKSYEEKRRRRREKGQQRSWKLKSMKAEAAEEPVVKGRGRHGNAAGAQREQMDRERFMEV